nr:hypothetical protein GCM10020092_078320 [Actinoplanes digitatis]
MRFSVLLAVDNVVKRHGVEGIFHSPGLSDYAPLTAGCLANLPAQNAADFVVVALRELNDQILPLLDEYRRQGAKILVLLDTLDMENGARMARRRGRRVPQRGGTDGGPAGHRPREHQKRRPADARDARPGHAGPAGPVHLSGAEPRWTD